MGTRRRLTDEGAVVTVAAIVLAAMAAGTTGLHPGIIAALALGGALLVVLAPSSPRPEAMPAAAAPDLVTVVGRELERSRRHEHPLTVVRLPRSPDGSVGAGGAGGVYLSRSLQKCLRLIDVVVCEGDSLYLVLPGSDQPAAIACIQRVREARPGLFIEAVVCLASFPDDGVTLTSILAVLDGCERAVAPDDLPKLERRRRISIDITDKNADMTTGVDA